MTTDTGLIYELALSDGDEYAANFARILNSFDSAYDTPKVLRSYGAAFRDDHLLPMAGAIWSAPPDTMLRYPAASFIRFHDNHGLLRIANRPQWRTVTGGSRSTSSERGRSQFFSSQTWKLSSSAVMASRCPRVILTIPETNGTPTHTFNQVPC